MLNLDYDYTTVINVPVHKRTLARLDWLLLHSKPLITQNTAFDIENVKFIFLASHTGQVLSIEHLLNNLLSPNFEITLEDGKLNEEIYIFLRGEFTGDKTYINNRSELSPSIEYIYTRDTLGLGVDTYIYIDNADAALIPAIDSYMKDYYPAGKVYEIKILLR